MCQVNNIEFGGKAIYEIKVVGRGNIIPTDLCEDKEVGTIQISNNKFKHSIKGIFRDQAELSGLLNVLYDTHFTILSVGCLENYSAVNQSNTI